MRRQLKYRCDLVVGSGGEDKPVAAQYLDGCEIPVAGVSPQALDSAAPCALDEGTQRCGADAVTPGVPREPRAAVVGTPPQVPQADRADDIGARKNCPGRLSRWAVQAGPSAAMESH